MKSIALLAVIIPAALARAQPESFADLGRHVDQAETFEVAVHLLTGNDIQWFRIELPAVSAAAGFVDFGTYINHECCNPNDMQSPEMGVYDNQGVLLPRFYFSGPNGSQHMSFGLTDPRPRPTHNGEEEPGGNAHGGQMGPLTEGIYWVAVASQWVGFNPTNWGVFSNTPPELLFRDTILRFRIQPSNLPYCDADLNWDGSADAGDIDYLVNVLAGGNNPTGRFPDFNRDGSEDQDDVAALINTIAGGGCPD